MFRNKRQRAAYFTNSDYHCALARTAAISSYSWNSSKVTQLEKNINVAMSHPLLSILGQYDVITFFFLLSIMSDWYKSKKVIFFSYHSMYYNEELDS